MADVTSIDPRVAEWNAEIANYPPAVRAVAERVPAYQCYRSTRNPGHHYWIYTYAFDRAGDVRLSLVHGKGDPDAGVGEYGSTWNHLIPCDCGKWEPPTKAEIARTKLAKGGSDDGCHAHSHWKPPQES